MLHDSAQNRIVALILRLGLARDRFEHTDPEVAARSRASSAMPRASATSCGASRAAPPPPTLATHGLTGALGAECAASALPVRMPAGDIGRSAPEIETAVHLCCLEAVQNAAKHAGHGAGVTIGEAVGGRVDALSSPGSVTTVAGRAPWPLHGLSGRRIIRSG